MTDPLAYNRNITHRSGNLLQSVTDEQARQWAREKWDGKVIGHSWHPAYIAACEELRGIHRLDAGDHND